MRRRLAALLIVPALALTATACGSDDGKKDATDKADSSSASPQAAAVPKAVDTANPMPKVAGAYGKKATITLPKGDPSDKFVVHTLSQGDGATVQKNDLVSMNFTGKIWKGGKDLGTTYGAQGGGEQMVTAGAAGQLPAFAQAVVGQKEGSRILVVAPPAAGFGAQGNQQVGITGTDTLVFALDVGKVIPKKAEGTQAAIPSNLPQIKADKEEPATISIPKNDPPKKLVDQVLINGKGAEIKSGQTVTMQYSGAAWKLNQGKAKAELFDSSWKTGQPFSTAIGQGQVIKGWDKGIVGKHVGDRVLLVIPPEQAYGSKDQGKTLPANSTLVFVVDILAAH
ncbi:FKBP-type peptidyl-prolyl cis-trans isomerase [Streptomyces sp. VRA16 Mangrove soil]|uniref:FKBP-type peptidyl-prolyl cis-trans isomerase n=1 Tax=Streptomyces sp. VRA16 Mangrove soil TaxID=2817434 RepID=UPI001A9D1986|nr:FKBP-type peptidyl-prolyl cis-trans isomerase [Streptomyces sp. VRA16 Mangrove soil]MBO1331786.1 FKBP-type peptidyl-prolyl cis-trans isomerase [Streptomyces sp. VRA16 Mangrove soil]